MSSYSFSPQFYQRWTCAPEPIRAAITQELTDITSLLQADTALNDFEFKFPDLDMHLDALYQAYDKQKAADEQIAEQQRLADLEAQKKQAVAEATQDSLMAVEAVPHIAQQNGNGTEYKAQDDSAPLAKPVKVEASHIKQQAPSANAIETTTHDLHSNVAISLSSKDANISNTHNDLLRELERQVDDYLSEQMAQMSENLKAWLRAEVTQYFGDSHSKEEDHSTPNNDEGKTK